MGIEFRSVEEVCPKPIIRINFRTFNQIQIMFIVLLKWRRLRSHTHCVKIAITLLVLRNRAFRDIPRIEIANFKNQSTITKNLPDVYDREVLLLSKVTGAILDLVDN